MSTRLEKSAEQEGCEYLEAHGWFVAKFTSPGLRGVPDRICIRNGRTVFIEWKRGNLVPSKQQEKRHREMREFGVEVYSFNEYSYGLFRKTMA